MDCSEHVVQYCVPHTCAGRVGVLSFYSHLHYMFEYRASPSVQLHYFQNGHKASFDKSEFVIILWPSLNIN